MIHLLISEPSLLLNATINKIVQETLKEKNEFNFVSLDFLSSSLEDILENLQSSSLFDGKKIIVVKNPYFFVDTKIKLPFNNDLSLFENYLYNPNENCEFIVICPKKYYNPKNKYFTIIQSIGEVNNLLIENLEDRKAYALELLKQANLEIENKALDLLVSRCLEITQLEKEIAKLILYNQKIDENVIETMVSEPLEDNVFELSNALLKKDSKKVMKVYTDLKKQKVEPIQLISMLSNQLRLLIEVSILKDKYRYDEDLAKILNVHPYRIKLARENTRKFTLTQIKKMLIDLAQLDIDIKKGSKDRYIDFEIFLASC